MKESNKELAESLSLYLNSGACCNPIDEVDNVVTDLMTIIDTLQDKVNILENELRLFKGVK